MGVTNFDEYRDVFVVADTIDDVVHPVYGVISMYQTGSRYI